MRQTGEAGQPGIITILIKNLAVAVLPAESDCRKREARLIQQGLARRTALVGRRSSDPHIWTERRAAVDRTGKVNIGHAPRGIVASVIETDVHRTIGRVNRKPLVKLIGINRIICNANGRAPGKTAVVRKGEKDIRLGAVDKGTGLIGLVSPGTIESSPMRPVTAIHIDRRIDQRAPGPDRRYARIEADDHRSDGAVLTKSDATVKRPVDL